MKRSAGDTKSKEEGGGGQVVGQWGRGGVLVKGSDAGRKSRQVGAQWGGRTCWIEVGMAEVRGEGA